MDTLELDTRVMVVDLDVLESNITPRDRSCRPRREVVTGIASAARHDAVQVPLAGLSGFNSAKTAESGRA